MTIARAHLVDPAVSRWYHCVTRCVRRAMLLGEGTSDRKLWIETRLRELAEIFALAVGGFAVLDNHLHLLVRLDPDSATRPVTSDDPVGSTPSGDPLRPMTVVDTRRYRWMIGIFGLAVVLIVSVYQFATNGTGTAGVPAGHRLRFFAAPLADTNLNGTPNLDPPCTLARHDPRALNVCLLVKRGPLVLGFFVTNSSQCEREVDTMQSLAARRGLRRRLRPGPIPACPRRQASVPPRDGRARSRRSSARAFRPQPPCARSRTRARPRLRRYPAKFPHWSGRCGRGRCCR